jgi:hypothetical protein
MDKALELWKRFFIDWGSDKCWVQDCYGDDTCFFCSESKPNHEPDCIWVEAEELVEVNKT